MRRDTALAGIVSVFVLTLGIGAPAQGAEAPGEAPFALSTMISQGLDVLARRALPLLISMAAIGVLTMALQQAIKDMLRLHVGFNRRRFEGWADAEAASGDARRQLLTLALGGTRRTATASLPDEALFELSIAALTAQLSSAAKFALAFPEAHEPALRLAVGPLGDTDVGTLVAVTAAEHARIAAGDPITPTHEAQLSSAEEARTRLSYLIDRRMDAFQVEATSRWEHRNKQAAFFLSALLALAAIGVYVVSYQYWTPLSKPQVAALGLMVPLAALVAGFVAPVAKDLVTALQSVRGTR